MPMFAGQAHPSGPEKRPFAERTITVQGNTKDCVLTLGYPKPDDIVDWAPKGSYSAMDPWRIPLTLVYEYRGHFWQGVFGGVLFTVKINARKEASKPWTDLESLLEGVRIQRIAHNQATKNNHPENRQEWMEPVQAQLNGIPCVQQYIYWGNDPKGYWLYYFPFEEDHALELEVRMVDNSNRPGLTQSDWRPRAEEFAKRLLSTVKVRVEPIVSQK